MSSMRELRRAAAALGVCALASLALSACDEVVVEPVAVSQVTVTPGSLALALGATSRLEATATDASGNTLPRPTTWSSGDPTVATVDGAGLVEAVGPGSTTISAAMGGEVGSATVQVGEGPVVGLDPTFATLSARRRGPRSEVVAIAVTNEGGGTLTGLSTSVLYDGDASGWLDVTLEDGTAPTNLRVQADPGLLEAGTYSAQVTVTGAAPAVDAVLVVTFQVVSSPPGAPQDLTATVLSSTSVRLDWTDASDDEQSFRVERRSSILTPFTEVGSVGANTTTFTDASLQPGTSYAFRIRACNAAGCSEYEGPVIAITAAGQQSPAAPSGLVADAVSVSEVRLEWTDNASNEDEFRVERRLSSVAEFALAGTTDADDTTFQDGGLSAGTSYVYRVQACNAVGCSAFTSEASASTPALTVPPPPSGLSAEGISASEIRLRWTDNSDNESRFEVQRRSGSGGGGWDDIADVGANVTEYIDAGLPEDTRYTYRVRACNAAGCSGYSAQDDGRTFDD